MRTINTNWEYNGLQLEIDMQDVDFAKKYQEVFAHMGEDAANMPKTGETHEMVEAYANMYQTMFDSLFGEGTALKLTGGKRSATKFEEAYDSMLTFITDQRDAVQSKRADMVARYSPNRAQRRAADKK